MSCYIRPRHVWRVEEGTAAMSRELVSLSISCTEKTCFLLARWLFAAQFLVKPVLRELEWRFVYYIQPTDWSKGVLI